MTWNNALHVYLMNTCITLFCKNKTRNCNPPISKSMEWMHHCLVEFSMQYKILIICYFKLYLTWMITGNGCLTRQDSGLIMQLSCRMVQYSGYVLCWCLWNRVYVLLYVYAWTVSVCNANEYRCTSGRCIPQSYKCDRTPQCMDGSDEGDVCSTYIVIVSLLVFSSFDWCYQ